MVINSNNNFSECSETIAYTHSNINLQLIRNDKKDIYLYIEKLPILKFL